MFKAPSQDGAFFYGLGRQHESSSLRILNRMAGLLHTPADAV